MRFVLRAVAARAERRASRRLPAL